jgi:hypothetical protein
MRSGSSVGSALFAVSILAAARFAISLISSPAGHTATTSDGNEFCVEP